MKISVFLRHAALGLLLVSGLAQASTSAIEIDKEPSLEFASHAEIFVDESGALEASAVAAQGSQFRPVTPDDLKRRYDSRVFWLRATLHNASADKIERWLGIGHARMENASLFEYGAQGWRGVDSGLRIPRNLKPVDAVGLVLPVTLEAGESRQILLRVQSRTAIDLNARLWQPTALLQADDSRQLAIAAGAGGSLIVAFISLSVFVRLRQRTYLYFSLLHLATMLMELGREGLWERYLWPAALSFPIHLHVAVGMTAALILIFIQRDFLDLRVTYPRWDRVFLAFVALSVAIALISPFNYGLWNEVWSRALLVVVVMSLSVAVMAWRRGDKTAGYLALGYGVAWVVEGLRAVSNLGYVHLPFTQYTSLTWALLVAAPMFFLALSEQSRKLHAQLQQSQQSSRAKSDFLARVSHELHSPLNTIIGYARMLRRGSARLSLQEGTSDIERNGLRLLAMIDELLDQSRLESGQLVLRPQPLALALWLSEMERAGKIQAEAAGNTFVLNCQGDLPPAVLLDGARLRQVLDNLISNANRHTEKGWVELGCKANKVAAADHIELAFSVMDNGRGIAQEEQKKIFEPFYQGQAKPTGTERRRVGVGLGLSIARDLVALLGGELRLMSKPGVGSSFHFDLVCPVVAEPVALRAPLEPLTPATTPMALGLRVLLADDDPKALRVLRDALESMCCRVDSVGSGQEAIGKLGRDPAYWDLVITDQVMANGDGWAVLAFARQHCAGLPVMLISGMQKHRPAGLPADVDFDGFLSKPVLFSELASALALIPPALAEQAQKVGQAGQAARTAGPVTRQALARPDASQLNDLLALVRLGEVSAIEDWCAGLQANHPELSAYAQQVHQAVQQLDFVALKKLTS
jgi:signal transduction histidine kinase/ActR/RegA family two-component response regulator